MAQLFFFGKEGLKRRALPVITVFTGLIALVLLMLLSTATSNTEFFDKYFIWLYAANIIVGATLILAIIILAIVIAIRWRKGRFGTRLIAKLAMIFGLVGIVPGIILYGVSWQFVSRSIETWFDVKVESALNSGLELGRVTLRIALEELQNEGRFVAEQVASSQNVSSSEDIAAFLTKMRDQFGIQEISVFNAKQGLVASARPPSQAKPFPLPDATILKEIRQTNGASFLDEVEAKDGKMGYRVRAIIPLMRERVSFSRGIGSSVVRQAQKEFLYIQLVRTIPDGLTKNILGVESAYSDYQEKALGRLGLRKMYIGALTLTLFFSLFVAITLALLLGRQLAQPLLMLLRGTQAVAQGDLSPKPELNTDDELGMLTRQFNVMTKQLFDARGSLQESKSFLETVLGNLTAGVCIFDEQFNLISSNAGATKILGQDLSRAVNQPLNSIPSLTEFDQAVRDGFVMQKVSVGMPSNETLNLPPTVWQKQIQLHSMNEYQDELGVALFVRGTQLTSKLKMVVFDDITDVVTAQRSLAWAEVARRLAHEIKNPLTPIQLSAERIQHRLAGQLNAEQQEIIERSTATIIAQVEAMKQMVNEFRDFAKTPSANLQPLSLNSLIEEVMGLYEGSPIQLNLLPNCPKVMGDSTQLRQVIHNLLQNAQDASAEKQGNLGSQAEQVEIKTELVEIVGFNQEIKNKAVRLTIIDNGAGFPAKILGRAFEPYITTKAKGTGLGLAVVKKIIDDHGAQIEIRNRKQGDDVIGAQVSILFTQLAADAA